MEFKAQRPSWYANNSTTTLTPATASFAVNAKLQATNTGTLVPYAKLQFDYTDDSTLKNIFDDRVFRYPPTGSMTASDCAAPGGERGAQGVIGVEIADHEAALVVPHDGRGGADDGGRTVEPDGDLAGGAGDGPILGGHRVDGVVLGRGHQRGERGTHRCRRG